MVRQQHDTTPAMVLHTCHRRNAGHTGLVIHCQYHETSTTLRPANPAARSLRTTAHLLRARSKVDLGVVLHVFKRQSEEPSLIDVLHDMMVIRQRLALAEHICQCTQRTPFTPQFDYTPLELPTDTRSYIESQYHMHPAQVKLFAFTAQHAHPLLPLLTHAPTLQRIATHHHQHQTPLYQQVTSYQPKINKVAPPTHVLRFLCTVLRAVNVWTDASALAHEPYHTPSQPWSQWNGTITNTTHIVLSAPDTPPAYQNQITSRSWVFRDTAPPPPPPPVAYARFRTTLWYLYASPNTVHSITDTQRLRIHCFFLHHHHGKS